MLDGEVVFYSKRGIDYHSYCFAHAVLRALEGETIRTRLVEHNLLNCNDCSKFGSPQSHELGSLRRD